MTTCEVTKICYGIKCKCCEDIQCYEKLASHSNRIAYKQGMSLLSVIVNSSMLGGNEGTEVDKFRSTSIDNI